VLRFTGYFKEAVVESRLENFRYHHLTVFYFLEDKSIMITEPKVVNSGVPQGQFLNRQVVLKPDGMSPFMPQDFCIGLDVGIYGRAIRITDCDDYTRQFFIVSEPAPVVSPSPAAGKRYTRHCPLHI
jgi:EF-hand domain-containing protein 1